MLTLDRPLAGKKIGLLGKGGCGKSTLAVLLARSLSRRYTVCLLDADSTNAGMYRALGLDCAPVPLLDYFGGMVFGGGPVTCPVDDPTLLEGSQLDLDRLPHEYFARSDEGIFFMTAGKIGRLGLGAGCDGPVAKIARDLQVRLAGGSDPVMLVDLKAGFEEPARGVITGLDWIVVVVDPTVAAVELALDLRRTLSQLQAGASPAVAHLTDASLAELARRLFREARVKGLLTILNRVMDEGTETYLRTRLAAQDVAAAVAIREQPEIARAWLRGVRIPSHIGVEETAIVVRGLEAGEQAHALPGTQWSSFRWSGSGVDRSRFVD
jgi:CO dehydrogenase maturation factor